MCTCSEAALREFPFKDKKGHTCWTMCTHLAAEIDCQRIEEAWSFNMLYAHDNASDQYVHGTTPTCNAELREASPRVERNR